MKCLYCPGRMTQVVNSRAVARGQMTWRRRRCTTCGKTFTTRETSIGDNLFVLKRNGSRQRFVYEKFFASIYYITHSGKGRDSGDAAKIAKGVADAVLKQVFKSGIDKNISTKKLIELTYLELRKVSRTFAFSYGTHSEYRSKTLTKLGFMA
ncbi:MAG: hypothetical protein WA058_03040 [Minisyncoccia bacterium]